jgi:hypothetical protein
MLGQCDKRINAEYISVASPKGNGSIKGYLVRPAAGLVHRDDSVPAFQPVGIADRAARYPGIVHQDVEPPVGLHRVDRVSFAVTTAVELH